MRSVGNRGLRSRVSDNFKFESGTFIGSREKRKEKANKQFSVNQGHDPRAFIAAEIFYFSTFS